ncbi:MAG: hypothetical protein CM15mP98_04720 [Paracoccaceae bacterium]|nr:MAG: hypothetical protein CM15mP98_04720 [Paracoccaceae bacterium]
MVTLECIHSQTLFGGQLDGYGGVNFWGTLGALVSAGLPGFLGGAVTLDQLVGSIVGNINFLNANGLALTADGPVPSPLVLVICKAYFQMS